MYADFESLKKDCAACKKCPLGETRTNLVFGVGNERAEVMFIGEGPGYNEDMQGEPFVGRGGQLLDKFLEYIDLDRHKNIYIANMVKCRPPENRDPTEKEQDLCIDWLREQTRLIRPKNHGVPGQDFSSAPDIKGFQGHRSARSVYRKGRDPLYGHLPPRRPSA